MVILVQTFGFGTDKELSTGGRMQAEGAGYCYLLSIVYCAPRCGEQR